MIRGESRLLQHTASTYLKTRDSPLRSRESLSLNSPSQAPASLAPLFGTPSRRGSVAGSLEASTTTSRRATDSPSRRTAESFEKHFQGAGVAEAFAPLPSAVRRTNQSVGQHRVNDDSNNTFASAFSPAPSPTAHAAASNGSRATSPYRSLRGQPPRQHPTLFGSSADDFREPSQQSSRAPSPNHANSGGRVGMWTNKDGAAAFTGSRRHFQNEGVPSRPCSPVRSFAPSLDASLTQRGADADLIRVYPQSYEDEVARRGKRVSGQSTGIQGSSCQVVGKTYEGKPFDSKGRSTPMAANAHRVGAPYAQSDTTTGGAPPPNAPPVFTQRQNSKPSILEHRDGRGAWEGERGAPASASSSSRGRSPTAAAMAPPPPSIANLGSAKEGSPRPSSIRAMAGPPAFVPPEMPARRGSPSRRQSPTRAESVSLVDGSSSMSVMTPRGGGAASASPVVMIGRGVGLYSPLRQRNPLFS